MTRVTRSKGSAALASAPLKEPAPRSLRSRRQIEVVVSPQPSATRRNAKRQRSLSVSESDNDEPSGTRDNKENNNQLRSQPASQNSTKKARKAAGKGEDLAEETCKNLDVQALQKDPLLIFKEAKSLLRTSSVVSGRLVGREKERTILKDFWQDHVEQEKGGSLYISGAPGTGKSALVEELLSEKSKEGKFKLMKVNCMEVGVSPKNIFSKLLAQLKPMTANAKYADADAMEELEGIMLGGKRTKLMHIIILDEIDQLVTKDQEVLYRIFEWPKMEGSKCVVIGIANALDLTHRFLPRLQAKNYQPQYLPYAPYEVKELVDILKSKLAVLQPLYPDMNPPFMQYAAVELCARKTASTGDLRKALDLCRQAIENAEIEYRNTVAKDAGSSGALPQKGKRPTVTILHTMKVIQSVYGSANPIVSKVRMLNIQQKLVLTIATVVDKYNKNPDGSLLIDMTVGKLYDIYAEMCGTSRDLLNAVSRTEFFDLVSAMESTGIIHLRANSGGGGVGGTTQKTPSKRSGTIAGLKLTPTIQRMLTPTHRKSPASGSKSKGTPSKWSAHPGCVDATMTLLLTADEKDVMTSVQDVPFLVQLLHDGLPHYITE